MAQQQNDDQKQPTQNLTAEQLAQYQAAIKIAQQRTMNLAVNPDYKLKKDPRFLKGL
jgi:hypothetical protein